MRMQTTLDEVQARESRHVLQTYRRAPVTFVRGQGVRLYDIDGREYVDLLSGIGVASLGHAHPALARVVAEQAQTLIHTSNLFTIRCRVNWPSGWRISPGCRAR